jgi:hypothetical protein
VTVGSDGNLYVTEVSSIGTTALYSQIDRVSPSGDIVAIPVSSTLGSLTLGPDGNLWSYGHPVLDGQPDYDAADITRLDTGHIILDQPLTATPLALSRAPGAPFTGPVATFTDADSVSNPTNYMATVDWGDGSPPSAGTITANGAGRYVVNASHTYGTTGTYSVTVKVTDIDASHDVSGAVVVAHSTASVGNLPAVAGVVSVPHSKKGITAIVIGFSEALDPSSAGNPAFYGLASGVKKKHKLVFSKGVKISSVSYDGNAHTVTLKLAKPTKGTMQVTVHRGVSATNGLSSSGDFTAVVK